MKTITLLLIIISNIVIGQTSTKKKVEKQRVIIIENHNPLGLAGKWHQETLKARQLKSIKK